jgi:hypothetical protein
VSVTCLSDIWEFHGSEGDDGVLGYDAMQTHWQMTTFWRNILSSSSGVKTASTDKLTWCLNLEQEHHCNIFMFHSIRAHLFLSYYFSIEMGRINHSNSFLLSIKKWSM